MDGTGQPLLDARRRRTVLFCLALRHAPDAAAASCEDNHWHDRPGGIFRALVLTVLPLPMEAGGIFTFATLDSLGGGALRALVHYDQKLRPHLPRLMKLCLAAGSSI